MKGRTPLVRVPDHPQAVGGYVPESRLVMEKHIGRLLVDGEEVRHRSSDLSDNRIENLILFAARVWPVEQIREWILQGRECLWIAKELGCCRSQIGRVCKKNGIKVPRHIPKAGGQHPCWKGGRFVTEDGYVMRYAPSHPFCGRRDAVLEHRLAMEEKIGRYLTREEVVHHKDENPSNNQIENLTLSPNHKEHIREHARMRREKAILGQLKPGDYGYKIATRHLKK